MGKTIWILKQVQNDEYMKDAKSVENLVDLLWESLWGNCEKFSTFFGKLKNLYGFPWKSRVLHRIVQKIYSLISTGSLNKLTVVGGKFYTFST